MIIYFIEAVDDKYKKLDKQIELEQNLWQLHAKHRTCSDFSVLIKNPNKSTQQS